MSEDWGRRRIFFWRLLSPLTLLPSPQPSAAESLLSKQTVGAPGLAGTIGGTPGVQFRSQRLTRFYCLHPLLSICLLSNPNILGQLKINPDWELRRQQLSNSQWALGSLCSQSAVLRRWGGGDGLLLSPVPGHGQARSADHASPIMTCSTPTLTFSIPQLPGTSFS